MKTKKHWLPNRSANICIRRSARNQDDLFVLRETSKTSNWAKSLPKIQCLLCMKYSMEGNVYCHCCTCLILTDATRKWSKKKRDEREARHDRSEEQRAHCQATECSKKTLKGRFELILHCFQTCEIYRSSQTNIGWTKKFCQPLDELAKKDYSYAATRRGRERYEKRVDEKFRDGECLGPYVCDILDECFTHILVFVTHTRSWRKLSRKL